MNYQRTKPASKRATKIIIAVAFVLILLRLIIPHAFGAFFADVFSPLWRLKNSVVRTFAPENQIIFSSDSSFASSTVAQLLQENDDLKNILGRTSGSGAVLATVLSKPPFSAYDSLVIDAGSDQGVVVGDRVLALANPVVYSTAGDLPPSASAATSSVVLSSAISSSTAKSSGKKLSAAASSSSVSAMSLSSSTGQTSSPASPQIEIPIGQVVATYGETSVVTLFSSSGQKYPVEIGAYHISATAAAVGAGMFEAMVPNNSNIMVGDPVTIPSIQAGVFASVVSVVSDPARPYSLVIFQSPVDPFSLYFVAIEEANSTIVSHETK